MRVPHKKNEREVTSMQTKAKKSILIPSIKTIFLVDSQLPVKPFPKFRNKPSANIIMQKTT